MIDEPTEAQGVAATVALARSIHGSGADHEDFDYYRKHVDAALVAAQGAAPQASEGMLREFSDYEDTLHQAIGDLLGNLGHELNSFDETRDFVADLFDLAAPVLPSSGVDEEKLAEVIESHVLGDPNGGTATWAWVNCSCGQRVEMAGVTREHVVALERKHQARAVAEWLKGQGGESRERDAALARIAEQREAMKRMKVQRRSNGRRAQQAEARIAEAAKLHRPRKHWNSDREYVFVCDDCTRINRYGIAQWPCPTAVSLGLNEGGTDD